MVPPANSAVERSCAPLLAWRPSEQEAVAAVALAEDCGELQGGHPSWRSRAVALQRLQEISRQAAVAMAAGRATFRQPWRFRHSPHPRMGYESKVSLQQSGPAECRRVRVRRAVGMPSLDAGVLLPVLCMCSNMHAHPPAVAVDPDPDVARLSPAASPTASGGGRGQQDEAVGACQGWRPAMPRKPPCRAQLGRMPNALPAAVAPMHGALSTAHAAAPCQQHRPWHHAPVAHKPVLDSARDTPPDDRHRMVVLPAAAIKDAAAVHVERGCGLDIGSDGTASQGLHRQWG